MLASFPLSWRLSAWLAVLVVGLFLVACSSEEPQQAEPEPQSVADQTEQRQVQEQPQVEQEAEAAEQPQAESEQQQAASEVAEAQQSAERQQAEAQTSAQVAHGQQTAAQAPAEQQAAAQQTQSSPATARTLEGVRGIVDPSNDRWPREVEGLNGIVSIPAKPLRIITASSNAGDTVLDPFCGCATTCVAAEKLDRQWIGIDISVKAYELVQMRLKKEVDKPQQDWLKGDTAVHFKTDPPQRTDQGTDYQEQKFVYVISHPHFPGEYKVGIAKDWRSRLNAYQTSDPARQYKMEFKTQTPWFRETEKHIHDSFPSRHEWVQGELNKIINAIKEYRP